MSTKNTNTESYNFIKKELNEIGDELLKAELMVAKQEIKDYKAKFEAVRDELVELDKLKTIEVGRVASENIKLNEVNNILLKENENFSHKYHELYSKYHNIPKWIRMIFGK